MQTEALYQLLEGIQNNTIDISHAMEQIKSLSFEDLGFAKEAQALLEAINAYEFETAKEILLGCKIPS